MKCDEGWLVMYEGRDQVGTGNFRLAPTGRFYTITVNADDTGTSCRNYLEFRGREFRIVQGNEVYA